jgi:hypothetical protein
LDCDARQVDVVPPVHARPGRVTSAAIPNADDGARALCVGGGVVGVDGQRRRIVELAVTTEPERVRRRERRRFAWGRGPARGLRPVGALRAGELGDALGVLATCSPRGR